MPIPRQTEFDPHAGPPGAARRWLAPLLLVLLASPLLLDTAALCHAQWSALFGPMPIVRTPALDLASSSIEEATDTLRGIGSYPMRRLPWRKEWAVGALVFSLAAGTLLLRHHRLR